MRSNFFILISCLFFCLSCKQEKEITVMQFNIWQEGTAVEGGFSGIVDNIAYLQPDFVTFSEVRNYDHVDFIPRLINALAEKGVTYYGQTSVSTGIISKYPIQQQDIVYPLQNDRGSVLKACFKIGNNEIIVYSAHLDWLNCAYYLPRGYGSCDWQKLEQPITNIDSILADNRASFRDDEIKALIADANREKGKIIIIGGDFNEPSHLDWQAETKDLRDHHGLTINWDCSMLLTTNGFIDAFREKYPDAVANPGFTFAADNDKVDLKKLVWSPEADERERIDFIYYQPDKKTRLKNIQIVGPSGSILCGQRTANDSRDQILEPIGVWPTDHKALLATFSLN